MATRRQIRSGFEKIINTFAISRSIPISFENQAFETPSSDVLYLRTYLLPAPDTNLSLCYNNENNLGLFQIDIVSPVNIGTKTAEVLAEDIKALYPQGSRVGTPPNVRISRPIQEMSGKTDKDRYVLSLSIFYSLI